MATENLKLKISVDTSEVNKSLTQVKQSMKEATNNTATAGIQQSAAATSASLKQVANEIQNLRNMNFLDFIISNFDKVKASTKAFTSHFNSSVKLSLGELGEALSFLNPFSKVNDEIWGLNSLVKNVCGNITHSLSKAFASSKIGMSINRMRANISNGLDKAKIKAEAFKETIKNKVSTALEKFSNTKVGASLHSSLTALRNSATSLKGAFTKLGSALKKMFSSIALGAAALLATLASIVALVKNTINVANQMKEMNTEASKINMSTQAYGEWGYVLKQCGIESDKLTDFVKKLTEKQNELRSGSEGVADAYKELGLSQEEVLGMGQEELFSETVERLQGIEDASQRTSLAYRIFSDDATQLNAVLQLNNGETASLINNYYALGAAPSQNLINSSNMLTAATTNLSYAWSGVKNTLAEGFMPIITQVVNWLTKAVAVIGVFLKAIFGVEISTSKLGSNSSSGGGGLNNYKNNLDSATESAEKLKRATMGFDELNVLPGKDSGGGSSGLGANNYDYGGGLGGGIDIPVIEAPDISKITAWVEKYKTTIQTVATVSLIAIGALMAVIGLLHGNIPMAIAGVGIAGLGIAIGNVEGGLFDRIGEAIFNWWDSKVAPWFKEKVAPKFTGKYWKEKFNKIRDAVNDKLGEIRGKISEKWKTITDWAKEKIKPKFTKKYWKEKFESIRVSAAEKLNDARETIKEKWKIVKDWFDEKIKPKFTKKYWKEKFETIRASISEKLGDAKQSIIDRWKAIKDWFAEKITPKFTKKYWKEKFDPIREAIAGKLGEAKTAISDKWKAVKEWFKENVKPKFTLKYWKEKFDVIKSAISTKLGEAKTAISGKWTEIKNWYNTNIKPKFTTDYWKGKFNSVKDGAKSAFNGVISVVETAVNNIINKINTLSWKIPDWVPKVGGERFGFNFSTVSIPRLATGGIATRSVLANIGEAGREAVLPLDRNTGWMDQLADKIAARNGGPSKLYLQVDGKTLGWVAIDNINKITKQTGEIPLAI